MKMHTIAISLRQPSFTFNTSYFGDVKILNSE